MACKCMFGYEWLTMRTYNSRTAFVGKLLSASTPDEDQHAIVLQYQVVTNYRNTPVGDTITIYRTDGCDETTWAYQEFIGREALIYAIYDRGSYDMPICIELRFPPPEAVAASERKLLEDPNNPEVKKMHDNVVHTWELINRVKQRGNKMMRSYHANGVLEAKGRLKNTLPDGQWKYYDDQGRIVEVTNYREGIKWGKSKSYRYENDTTYLTVIDYEGDRGKSHISWINDKLYKKSWETVVAVNSYKKSFSFISESSTEIYYDENKNIVSKRTSNLIDKEKGMYHTFQFFYYPNGQVKEQWVEEFWTYGNRRIGSWLSYAEDGQLLKEVQYDEKGHEIDLQN